LKHIFFDEHQHWDRFVEKHGNRVRTNVIKEVDKFRTCGTYENGFKLFVCEGRHDVRKIAFRCKGRFCTSCSNGETEEWGRLMAEDMLQVSHRHVIFTIDEGLRNIFLQHREMLKPFMDEAVKLIQEWFKKKCKVVPGIIAGLHTFGSRINFNPHIHMLVTMGGMKKDGEWKVYDYIPFPMLRKQWQTVVLKLIRRTVSGEEKKQIQPLLQKAYSENKEGFYIYAPKQKGNVREQLKYIGRYLRRPAIALHRIEEYDGQFVTFRYYDKTEQKEKRETVSVEEFIARLIRHIPDEQFKLIRHYGVYSRKLKTMCKKLITAWQKEVRKWIVNVRKVLRRRRWREKIREGTGKDPMICSVCECYYEYKGEVCLYDGELKVKYAVDDKARRYLKREIEYGKVKEEKTQKERRNDRVPVSSRKEQGQLCLFGVQ
jgi:hypothetical protein